MCVIVLSRYRQLCLLGIDFGSRRSAVPLKYMKLTFQKHPKDPGVKVKVGV